MSIKKRLLRFCLIIQFLLIGTQYLESAEQSFRSEIPEQCTKCDCYITTAVFNELLEMVTHVPPDWQKRAEFAIPEQISIFGGPRKIVPQCPQKCFLIRIKKHFKCSPQCYVLALIYVKRFITLFTMQGIKQSRVFNDITFHRIFLVAMVLAVKTFEESCYGDWYYAKIGGIPMAEIINLEKCFLQNADCQLFVTDEAWSDEVKSLTFLDKECLHNAKEKAPLDYLPREFIDVINKKVIYQIVHQYDAQFRVDDAIKFLNTIKDRLNCPPKCYLFAWIYLQRFIHHSGDVNVFNSQSFQNIFLAALALAADYFLINFTPQSGEFEDNVIKLKGFFLDQIRFDWFIARDEIIGALMQIC